MICMALKLRTLATKIKINHVSMYTRSILRVTYFQSEYYQGQNEESLSHTIDYRRRFLFREFVHAPTNKNWFDVARYQDRTKFNLLMFCRIL